MKKTKKHLLLFAIGAIGYGIIEFIWRGYTHPTMLLAGGICFVAFAYIAKILSGRPLIYKALLSAVAVTAVELVFGLVFNVGLKMHVWDYSKLPLNFKGQICPLFTLLWGVLGFVFVPLAAKVEKVIDKSE